MLLGTLNASLLKSLLTGKDKITAGEGTVRESQDFYLYPLTNFEIQKHY